MSDALKPLIGKAADGALTRAEAEAAFAVIMSGEATMAQIGGLLMALRTRGEAVDEIAGAAAAMRAKAAHVAAPPGAMDIVGTGGDGKGTLNISKPGPDLEIRHGGRDDRARHQRHGRAGGRRARTGAMRHLLHDGADAPLGDEARDAGAAGTGHPHRL
jgi:hypothetical protein